METLRSCRCCAPVDSRPVQPDLPIESASGRTTRMVGRFILLSSGPASFSSVASLLRVVYHDSAFHMSMHSTNHSINDWSSSEMIDASPGYFAQTMDNEIKMEATSTRRAGLERFTFPSGSKPYFVLDLSNDLPASFAGGTMDIDPQAGRITIGGSWGPRFVQFNYLLKACDGYAADAILLELIVSARLPSIIKHSHAMIFLATGMERRSWTSSACGLVTRVFLILF